MPEFRYNPKYRTEEPRPLSCPGADIWIHDTALLRAVEITKDKSFLLEVMYPIDWHAEIYGPKSLIFHDVSRVTFKFGDVAGRPWILDITETERPDSTFDITLGTNHGDCVIECKSIELKDGWISTSDPKMKFDLDFSEESNP